MAYNFPNSPAVNDIYERYKWDGEKWILRVGGRGIVSVANRFRYWGVEVTALQNASAVACNASEIQMRTSSGGANVLTSGMTCTSITNYGGWEANKAIDGNAATAWAATETVSTVRAEIWTVDLGAGNEKYIVEVVWRIRTDALYVNEQPKDMRVICSQDGVNWLPAWTIPSQGVWTIGEERTFTNPSPAGIVLSVGPYAYWRMTITRVNYDGENPAVAELEWRATAGGADQASGGTAFSNGDWSPAANAFDNNAATDWVGSTNLFTTPGQIGYQHASPVSVAQISMSTTSDGYYYTYRAMRNATIEYSSDGVTYATSWLIRHQGTSFTSNGQTKTFARPVGLV